jgi:hypothetical protein
MATVLTNVGKAITTGRVKGVGSGAGSAEPNYVAWGVGAGTAAATDTTLFTETGSRVAGTSTQQTTSVTNDTYQVVGTLTAGGSLTITNAGLFDAASSGNLYMKGDFTGIALTLNESIQFTMKVQYS